MRALLLVSISFLIPRQELRWVWQRWAQPSLCTLTSCPPGKERRRKPSSHHLYLRVLPPSHGNVLTLFVSSQHARARRIHLAFSYLSSKPGVESEAQVRQCLLFKARLKHYTGKKKKKSLPFPLFFFFLSNVIPFYQTNNFVWGHSLFSFISPSTSYICILVKHKHDWTHASQHHSFAP